jgi:hypothetical protein|tara:strand:- start:475 stop:678 length:204 start_codon:yes stop_codon:yes gene_type:complete
MSEEETVTIDHKEYKVSELPEGSVELIQSIAFTESEVIRANAIIAVMTTAKAGYNSELSKKLKEKQH